MGAGSEVSVFEIGAPDSVVGVLTAPPQADVNIVATHRLQNSNTFRIVSALVTTKPWHRGFASRLRDQSPPACFSTEESDRIFFDEANLADTRPKNETLYEWRTRFSTG